MFECVSLCLFIILSRGSSILVLGKGIGDILAHDVSVGQLNWQISDCHPGWVIISFFFFFGLDHDL